MARSTFKVLFYVNGSKERNGIVPIMGRVTINGTVAQFSCKRNILKTLWDAKGNRAKGKSSLTMAGLSLRLTCDLLGNGSRSSLRSCSKGYTDLYHRKGKTGE